MKQLEIPTNLNLEDLLKIKYPEYTAHLEKFYYLIHMIRLKWFLDYSYKKLERISKKTKKKLFIPLHNEHLRYILHPKYAKKILEILIDENIIETNNHYKVGEYSKGYRLNETYQHTDTKTYYLKDKILENKIMKKEKEENEAITDLNKQILEMIKTRFTFDYENAFKLITQQYHANIIEFKSFIRSFAQLKELEKGNIFINESEKTGRIFHTYSNMKKDLRRYFIKHIRNDKLIEIDIANSQPFFLGLLLSQLEPTADINAYIDLVKNGNFYSFLQQELKIEESYDKLKETILTMLYCPSYWNIKHKERFDEIFPSVSSVMKMIKAEDYKNLAIELQKLEADMMIKTIAPILLEKQIDFIPIHDSFIIEERNKDIVIQIINDAFQDKYKLIPTLKIK